MIPGILLLLRRREQVVLCIIINHGLRKQLILRVTLGGFQMLVHEGCHLIHI